MSALRGIVVVLLGGLGVALWASAFPRFRRSVLARRLTPYLGTLGARRSALLEMTTSDVGWAAVFQPALTGIGERLHRILDDEHELPHRLQAAGSELDPSGFRAAQVSWGLAGLVGGLVLGLVLAAAGRALSPVVMMGMAMAFGATGVAARDRALTRAVARRR